MKNFKKELFFKLQRSIGSQVEKYYQEFLNLEKASASEIQSVCHEKLNSILAHAIENIPYYKDRVPYRKNIELSDFPILTKENIKDHFTSLMTDDLHKEFRLKKNRKKLYSWAVVKTGGSTGVPTTVIHDREFRDRGRASRLYSQYLCGFPIGTPYFRLWGSMNEINRMDKSYTHRIMRFLSNEILLNAFKMDDRDIEKYINLINESDIEYVMAYVDAAYHMAKYARKVNKPIKQLKSIMACAGNVTDEVRDTFQDVFRARVHNKYGSRDCSDMACECEKGGMHIYSHHVFLEIVDSENNKVPAGTSGRILVTLLDNYAFPLIRYEIGDVGIMSNEYCECGRPFSLLKNIEGRTVEFLLNSEGGYVSPVYFRHLIGVVHNPGIIKRFRILQESRSKYELQLELESDSQDHIYHNLVENITRDLKATLGEKSIIKIKKVSKIPELTSGKFLYSINKMKYHS